MKSKFLFYLLCLLFTNITSNSFSAPAEVQLVLGSDTAIWEGMNVDQYHCRYTLELYTDPDRNAYKVMDPAFRAQFRDSDGQPLKMTWWMMAGNIFRYSQNRDVPLPNTMTLYLMQKYHGHHLQQNGDELSLHYHTFVWSDYNGDGKYYWNQALNFEESRADFDVTLAQFLLEHQVVPVSFRSGWHYMDNQWQHYLDQILPYSMHNDYPHVRKDTTEPLDNTYDWSLAPKTFVPYQPDTANYQVPGAGRGWNVRSIHIGNVSQALMDQIFSQAESGIEQVACLWGHLPETDFLENIAKIHHLAQAAAVRFPQVKFHYCTAVEAMQRWRKITDQQIPEVQITEVPTADRMSWVIETNEPIFQAQPLVAVKDIYERYLLVPCWQLAPNRWQVQSTFRIAELAQLGVAVCDTVGNLTTEFIHYLPEDLYIDNVDPGYTEINGHWTTTTTRAWGLDARQTTLTESDSIRVRWQPQIQQSGHYNTWFQVPAIQNLSRQLTFKFYGGGSCLDTVKFDQPLKTRDWIYLGTPFFKAGQDNFVEMEVYGKGQADKVVVADVVKFSALVRPRDLVIDTQLIEFGAVSQDAIARYELTLSNQGLLPLTISGIAIPIPGLTTSQPFPFEIAGMSSQRLMFEFQSNQLGAIVDTLILYSNDPLEPEYRLAVTAEIKPYFVVIDNEDSTNYLEVGQWARSNAQAYGGSSRYAYLNQAPPFFATFTARLPYSGVYEISEIVPSTVNAADHAVYVLSLAEVVLDSIECNQNQGSGAWVSLGRHYLPKSLPVTIKVFKGDKNTNSNAVLRADAIQFALIAEISAAEPDADAPSPSQFLLAQNYPNPFNASTTFQYYLARAGWVQLKIFNAIGEEIAVVVDGHQTPGPYTMHWDASQLASGNYFYSLKASGVTQVRKLVVLK